MSINDAIDACVKCAVCGTRGVGKCDCWQNCVCGLTVRKGKLCDHPVHGDFGRAAFSEGYYILDEETGRPRKTHNSDLRGIRKRMDEGTIWLTRKKANAAAKVERKGR